MKRTLVWLAAVLTLSFGAMPSFPLVGLPAYAQQEDWKAEYEDICAKTSDPLSLSKPEIKSLVERCDKLLPRIEKLADESTRKVYLKRLKMCRDLFAFVLEQPEQSSQQTEPAQQQAEQQNPPVQEQPVQPVQEAEKPAPQQ